MNSELQNADISKLKISREEKPQKSSVSKIAVVLLLLAVVAAVGYFFLRPGAVEVEVAVAVKTSQAQANSAFTASGYVVAQIKAALSSKASGRLLELHVVEGDQVKRGSIIAKIESADVIAAVMQAKANLELAKADLRNAEVDAADALVSARRQRLLRKEQVNSLSELDNSEARLHRAEAVVESRKAAIQSAEAALRSAEIQVENTVIRAPFDGTVLTKNANIGEVITSMGGAAGSRGAVVTLADMNSLEVEADVSESNIERIYQDQPCDIVIDAYPEVHYAGFVGKIIPTADRQKATIAVKIRFTERDAKVLPEMQAKVSFLNKPLNDKIVSQSPKIVVPLSAVVQRNGRDVVFIVNGSNNTVQQREIQRGNVVGSLIEIKTGVQQGETVAVNIPETLTDGSSISVKENN